MRVTGYARERFNQTTINGSDSNSAAVPAANIVQCGTGSVAPTDVTLPVTSLDDFERYEGMLVRFPQALVIAEYFNFDRFGEIVLAQPLAGETRPFTGTAIDEPGAPANARTAVNALSRITLDDVQSAQNPSTLRHPNGLPSHSATCSAAVIRSRTRSVCSATTSASTASFRPDRQITLQLIRDLLRLKRWAELSVLLR